MGRNIIVGLYSNLQIPFFHGSYRLPWAVSHKYSFSIYFRMTKYSLWFHDTVFHIKIKKEASPSSGRLRSQFCKLIHAGWRPMPTPTDVKGRKTPPSQWLFVCLVEGCQEPLVQGPYRTSYCLLPSQNSSRNHSQQLLMKLQMKDQEHGISQKIRAITEPVWGRFFKNLGWPCCERQLQKGNLHLSHVMSIAT